MAKNTGKRKHWSQHALAGAGAAIGAGRKVRQRVRRAVKRISRTVSRFRKGRRPMRRKKTDVIGTFVKCKDWKPSKFGVKSKKYQSFARKVNSVVYDNLPRSTELYSYAWAVSNYSNASNGATKWFQFVLDPLQAAIGSYNIGNGQLQQDFVSEPGNPAGIGSILKQENVFKTSTAGVTGPTVLSSTFDKQNNASIPIVNARKEVLWRQSASSCTVQFKNIKSYAMTLEVMIVKPKKAIQSTVLNSQTGGWNTDGAAATQLNRPTGWTFGDQMGMTPLELGQIGLARVGANAGGERLHLWNNKMLSLNDSTDFNDFYKITHKCKVYLPPGGVVEKSMYHGSARLLKMAHVTQNLFDKRTSFMVVKYTPEVQLLETPQGAILDAGIPSAVNENGSIVDLVGTINYRMGFKQIYGSDPQSNVHQYNRQVISSNVVGGIATSVHTKAP
jgi:hypothetical protein